ncbi:biotin synthetase [Haematococcus lacustris]|uniref:Biotin synthetase n=1 Tax=Haematococcus lacustris TaxID=44745 RepID=A0A6A0AAB4_HAELA|nr:biotin synthetase [Haematococcus lacustris]
MSLFAGLGRPLFSGLLNSGRQEVTEVYETPLLELVFQASRVHRMYNNPQMAG